MTRLARFTLALLGALLLTPAFAPMAEAQNPVRGEVLVVLAKESAGEVDPALQDITALRQPPFNAFRSLSILERQPMRLSQGTPQDIELPNGRVLRVELQRVMPDGRFRVRVSIKRGGDDTAYLPLLQVVTAPGDPFFVAGQAHDGGTLVIGIRLGT